MDLPALSMPLKSTWEHTLLSPWIHLLVCQIPDPNHAQDQWLPSSSLADRYLAVSAPDMTFWFPRFVTQPLAFSIYPTLWANPQRPSLGAHLTHFDPMTISDTWQAPCFTFWKSTLFLVNSTETGMHLTINGVLWFNWQQFLSFSMGPKLIYIL